MSHVIYPHQFFNQNNDNTEEEPVSDHDHDIEFSDLTPEEEASKLLIPHGEPDLIFTSPRPGLEGFGLVINDTRLGSHTLLLTVDQVRIVVDQLMIGLANLDAFRAEVLYRGDRRKDKS